MDAVDYDVWKANFGSTLPATGTAKRRDFGCQKPTEHSAYDKPQVASETPHLISRPFSSRANRASGVSFLRREMLYRGGQADLLLETWLANRRDENRQLDDWTGRLFDHEAPTKRRQRCGQRVDSAFNYWELAPTRRIAMSFSSNWRGNAGVRQQSWTNWSATYSPPHETRRKTSTP